MRHVVPLFGLVKSKRVTIFDAVPSFQRHCLNELRDLDQHPARVAHQCIYAIWINGIYG